MIVILIMVVYVADSKGVNSMPVGCSVANSNANEHYITPALKTMHKA